MANRHLSRSIVLQTLFELDFDVQNQKSPLSILNRNTKDFGPGLEDSSFMETLLLGVLEKKKSIDEIIEKAAPEWPLNKI